MLTGGGDCPGLNAAIRAVVRGGVDNFGDRFVGFRDGWHGVLEASYIELDIEATRGILPRGGTILGSSRTNPYKRDDGVRRVSETFAQLNLDGLIAIGGEDTLGVANKLHQEGFHVIGVPKTIDNDLGGTDVTFGFDTAVQIATDAIDRLHTTAESHHRILVVEVMGRSAGWIALHCGIAGGADVILIPEIPFDIDEVCRLIERRHARGHYFSIVVAAEGATPRAGTMDVVSAAIDEFGHPRLGGIGARLEHEIELRTGYETRATVLGHVQRGGTPTAFDRVLATRLGLAAIRGAHDGAWGTMVSLHGNKIELVALSDAVAEVRRVPTKEYKALGVLFGVKARSEMATLGYTDPLYILAFDHRGSFQKKMFGIEGDPTPEQTETIADAKRLIVAGMLEAVSRGAEAGAMGVLVDEQFGSNIPDQAREHGLKLAMPVEKSGQDEFDFQYGEEFGAHIEKFDPDFSKVLVRYNPDGDAGMNRRQLQRLKRLADWLHERDRKFLFELLVPATDEQLSSVDGDPDRYDAELRPELMRRAIEAIQNAGIEVDVWKIEGVDEQSDAAMLAEQARSGQGREGVTCVLLGRGASTEKVERWLHQAAPVEGFVGFAIGRSIWWDSLKAFLAGELDRETAAKQIAENYLHFVRVYKGQAVH